MYPREVVIKAIKGSIRKWRRIVLLYGKEDGYQDCPLCDLFFGKNSLVYCSAGDGQECPIHVISGDHSCMNTPYDAWVPGRFRRVTNLVNWYWAFREYLFLKKILKKYKRR